MDKYHPKYFLHGHVHANYGKGFKRKDVYGTTRVINGYEFYVIEYPGEPVVSAEKKGKYKVHKIKSRKCVTIQL